MRNTSSSTFNDSLFYDSIHNNIQDELSNSIMNDLLRDFYDDDDAPKLMYQDLLLYESQISAFNNPVFEINHDENNISFNSEQNSFPEMRLVPTSIDQFEEGSNPIPNNTLNIDIQSRTLNLEEEEEIEVEETKKIPYKTQRFYGKWLYYEKKFTINKNTLKNIFIKNNYKIIDYALYFTDDIPKFISSKMKNIKNLIIQYGYNSINISIKNKNYFLMKVDYEKLIKPTDYKLNVTIILKSDLATLFSDYQKNENNYPDDHNKKVVKYIKDNIGSELEAYNLLNLTFIDLVKKFIDDKKSGLDAILNIFKKKMKSTLEKKQQSYKNDGKIHNLFINEKIEAFCEIQKMLCEKFEFFFTSIQTRKKNK